MIHVVATTVERIVFESSNVGKVIVPTTTGEITILPNHASLMSVLDLGEIRIYDAEGKETSLFVDGGILQLQRNHLEILATVAERAEDLDIARIEEAKRRAEKLLEEKPIDIDISKVEASLKRELMKQKLVTRRQK